MRWTTKQPNYRIIIFYSSHFISQWLLSSSYCRFGICVPVFVVLFTFSSSINFLQLTAHDERLVTPYMADSSSFSIEYANKQQSSATLLTNRDDFSLLLFLFFFYSNDSSEEATCKSKWIVVTWQAKSSLHLYFIVVVKEIINNTTWDLHINCLTLIEINFYLRIQSGEMSLFKCQKPFLEWNFNSDSDDHTTSNRPYFFGILLIIRLPFTIHTHANWYSFKRFKCQR